jgi:hypothetical protein
MFDYMFMQERQGVSNMDFFEYQDLLAAIFWRQTSPISNMFPEMTKQAFCRVLEDAKILRLPKVEEKKVAAPSKGKDSKKKEEEIKQQEEAKNKTEEILF